MNLISDFKDYYDFAIYSFFSEDKRPWVRKKSIIDLNTEKSYIDIYNRLKESGTFNSPLFFVKNKFLDNLLEYGFPKKIWDFAPVYNTGIISIGENLFPIIYSKQSAVNCKAWKLEQALSKNECVLISGNKNYGDILRIYSDVDSFVKDLDFGKIPICFNKNKAINELKNWFESVKKMNLEDISLRLDTPIWFYTNFKLIKNPKLQNLGIPKIIDGIQVAQTINMFFDNIMVSDELPKSKFPPLTDIDKLEAHGFDKKVSFRKR